MRFRSFIPVLLLATTIPFAPALAAGEATPAPTATELPKPAEGVVPDAPATPATTEAAPATPAAPAATDAAPAAPVAPAGTEAAPAATEAAPVAPTVTECKKGEVFDQGQAKCVEAKSGIDDKSLYEAGRDLANYGRYEEAIRVLELASSKDEKILNYLGYSNRQIGNIELGLQYYHAAIAANPDYSRVREYLGEAYLLTGNLAGAQEQLAEIRRICGGSACEEFQMLDKQIADYVRLKG